MGTDKALLGLGGQRVIEHVIQHLQPLVQGIYLVVNEPEPYGFLGLPVIRDAEPHQGPLMGLYSGLLACPTPWALAVACDTPFLEGRLLRGIIEYPRTMPILLPQLNGEPQPLPALYSTTCARASDGLLRAGHRALRDLVAAVPVALMEEAAVRRLDPEIRSFFDVDTDDKLRQAQRLAERVRTGG